MTALAVRYARRMAGQAVEVAVPAGGVTRLHLPDESAKSHLVTALLKVRCEPEEELELFGEAAAGMSPRERDRLRARVGAVSPVVGLITNLNAWENISLPAAYHGRPSLHEVARLAQEVLEGFGIEPRAFLARLPDELGKLERRIASFVRLLVSAPELTLFDALDDGLSEAESQRVRQFEDIYRAHRPDGTVLYVDTREAT
jgi:ABC-type transporter Mla maintaining outer membrane lipid asymmetry ATPase subunit MlaF